MNQRTCGLAACGVIGWLGLASLAKAEIALTEHVIQIGATDAPVDYIRDELALSYAVSGAFDQYGVLRQGSASTAMTLSPASFRVEGHASASGHGTPDGSQWAHAIASVTTRVTFDIAAAQPFHLDHYYAPNQRGATITLKPYYGGDALFTIDSASAPDRISGVLQPTRYSLEISADADAFSRDGNVVSQTADGEATFTAPAAGDANFDGAVNFDDLIILAQHYNKPLGQDWSTGDLTGDGAVNFDDLIILAQHYNQPATHLGAVDVSPAFAADWALVQSLVPEPGSIAAFVCAAGVSLGRRRRDGLRRSL